MYNHWKSDTLLYIPAKETLLPVFNNKTTLFYTDVAHTRRQLFTKFYGGDKNWNIFKLLAKVWKCVLNLCYFHEILDVK